MRFGRTEVLKGIDAEVPAGAVCGFVGLNGAGKTTTIECSLGLLKGYRGEIRLLDRPPHELPRLRGRIGVVFDSPCLYPHLTVRQSLNHVFLLTGRKGRAPGEAEELLGVARFRDMKTRHLSLGNRRRTSIAAALVGRPELVILDEPFSGLDTGGVDDVVALIHSLTEEHGITFLLSSHQLHHIEKICSHLCIIHEGKILAQGTRDELLSKSTASLEISVDDRARALELLSARSDVEIEDGVEQGLIRVILRGAEPAALNSDLVRAGIAVSGLLTCQPSLERLFRELVEGES